ncbi:MAG: polyprenyl synthetase family protein [Prolixibacteraceae bacterium]|nr:polyprenyl synthetase family protein [Prolixibacteraceae bacterium]
MQHYHHLLALFNAKLEEEIESLKKREPVNLYEPVIYTLNMGGKRIRPVLLLMAYEMYQNRFEEALPAALAIEMFHNFTLLHDDIMDKADLRRNFQTVHLKYSGESAILSGDAMSILSYEYLLKCPATHASEVFTLFTETALKICEGQQFDMDFENLHDVSVADYLKMIGLKTAILLACSLKAGALIGGASDKDAQLLYDFGYHLGLAFQLQDDLLDAYGTTNEFGKNIGGDIVANKKTFLLLKSLELASGNIETELKALLSAKSFDKNEKIRAVKNIYDQLDVVRLSENEMESCYAKAIKNLDKVAVDECKKRHLYSVASQLMKRNS